MKRNKSFTYVENGTSYSSPCEVCGQTDRACAKCVNGNKWIPMDGSLTTDYNDVTKSYERPYEMP